MIKNGLAAAIVQGYADNGHIDLTRAESLDLVKRGRLIGSAGCGGDDGEPSAQCKAESENAARAAVIAAAYEEGRIGTQAEVDAAFPGDESLFDDEGNMIAYDELEGLTHARFDEWVSNGPYIRGEVQRDALAAQQQVREDGWPDC